MSERDEQGDPDVRESVDAFRRAGNAASDGLRMLYARTRAWLERRRLVVRTIVGLSIWFGGNWAYNRIAPAIIEPVRALVRQVSFEVSVTTVFGILDNRPMLAFVPALLILFVTVIVQNRAQTRKLKSIESKVTTMSDSAETSTDGGTRELPPTGPRAIGGAIIGAIIGATVGIWFGPGSILAGIFLGFTTGDRWDIRAYERDPLAPDPNRETRTEQ